ncbi:hypothetical protein ACVWVY_004714 [Bradyrhizobium sp. URHC0002]
MGGLSTGPVAVDYAAIGADSVQARSLLRSGEAEKIAHLHAHPATGGKRGQEGSFLTSIV